MKADFLVTFDKKHFLEKEVIQFAKPKLNHPKQPLFPRQFSTHYSGTLWKRL